MLIPDIRGKAAGLKIEKETPLRDFEELAKGNPERGVHTTAEAGRLRIVYKEYGRELEEELFASVSQFVTQLPPSGMRSGYCINYWFIDNVFSFRADKGCLDMNSQ